MRLFFLILGFVALGLGTLGIVVPGLPTTPLFLLAAYSFSRSSERFERWLKRTRLYKKYASDFAREGTMTRKQKTHILIVSNVMMLIAIVIVPVWWVRGIIFLAMLIQLYVFLVRIPTKLEDEE